MKELQDTLEAIQSRLEQCENDGFLGLLALSLANGLLVVCACAIVATFCMALAGS